MYQLQKEATVQKLKLSEKAEAIGRIRARISEELDSGYDSPFEYLSDATAGVQSIESAEIEDLFEGFKEFIGRNLEDESGQVHDAVAFEVSDIQRTEGSWWVGGTKFELNLTEYMAAMLEHSRAVVQEREDRLELD